MNLAQNASKRSLHPDVVSPQLEDLLEWRVVIGVSRDIEDLFFGRSIHGLLTCHLVQGRIIDAKKDPVENLNVFAMCGQAEHYPDETKLSKYYDYKPLLAATKGKPNGTNNVDQCPAATE